MYIDNIFLIIISALLAINVFAFLLMMIDKIKSTRTGAERISEGQLFFLAAFFGAIGVYLGMFAFRHKTKKWYFLVGVPLLIIQNLAFAYLVCTLF